MDSAEFYGNASFHENTVLLFYHPLGQVLHCQHTFGPTVKMMAKRSDFFIIVSSVTEKNPITCSLKNHILPFFLYFLQLLFFSHFTMENKK